MKHNIIQYGLYLLTVIIWLTGCKKDFLEVAPLASLDEATLSTAAGANAILIGAYSLLDNVGGAGAGNGISSSNWVFGGIAGGDAYKGSTPGDLPGITPIETFTSAASNSLFNSKWQITYDGVQRSNDVIRILVNVTDMTETAKEILIAEARFLRGHYHFEAKKMWDRVPYIDETITYAAGNVKQPNATDIWPQIEADFQYGIDHLPAIQSAVGRANKWAAMTYLAKAKLFQNKFPEAKKLFDEIIANGVTASGKKYKLVRFSDNFNAEQKNNTEAVFSVQFSVNDNSNGRNGNRGDRLNSTYNGGPAGGSGFYQPTQSLVNSFRVDANGLPFLETFNDVNVKNDQGLNSSAPYTPETASLDPRLDWTVGRRGIPYLDWGLHPGQDWIRDQSNGGPYAPIKNIYYKRQEGTLTDKSVAGHTANNYTMIRFSDVLLMAAETEVEAGTLTRATELINMVRSRAADNTGWVHTYINNAAPLQGFTNTPAANYKIGLYPDFGSKVYANKAIRFERKLELAMEGHRFFDIVRYGDAATEINAFISKEKPRRTYFSNAVFVPNKHEYFPIPQTQIDLSSGTLTQNNGY